MEQIYKIILSVLYKVKFKMEWRAQGCQEQSPRMRQRRPSMRPEPQHHILHTNFEGMIDAECFYFINYKSSNYKEDLRIIT